MTHPRNALLVALLIKVIAGVTPDDAPPCYGFFGCKEESEATNEPTPDAVEEGCTGFGCEGQLDSQDDPSTGFLTPGTCAPVSLELTTDGSPEDISFDLICNGSPVWTYPSDVLPLVGEHEQISLRACIFVEHACCRFVLHDSRGDGLTDGEQAAMALTVDGQDILIYNSLVNPPFTTLAKSFGNLCSASPEVNVTPKDQPEQVDCRMGLERTLSFRITLDDHPEHLSWFLVCNDDTNNQMVTVWDTPRGSLVGHVGQVAAEQACIPYHTTCVFTIVDSQGDGLSPGSGYTLTLGVSLLDAVLSHPFTENSYCIGEKCGNGDDQQKASEETANTVEDEELQQDEADEKRQENWEPLDEDNIADLLEEQIISQEAGDQVSTRTWILATLGVVGFMLLLAAGIANLVRANRNSGAARAALTSTTKNGTNSTHEDSTEPDEYNDGSFCLDA